MKVDYSSDDGNSIDKYIKNGYKCDKLSDSEYISDDSLNKFLKNLDD